MAGSPAPAGGRATAARARPPGANTSGFALGLLACLPLLASCDAGGGNPLASFESRCAALPRGELSVDRVPVVTTLDETEPAAALATKGGSAAPNHRTLGVTTAKFGYQSEVEVRALEDRRGARACGHAFVRVRLAADPLTVYLARELADDPCKRAVTLEHEERHVAVYRAVLAEAAPALEQLLQERVGTELRRAASGAELQRDLDATVRTLLGEFMRDHSQALIELQAEVDSPDEYARLSAACRQ